MTTDGLVVSHAHDAQFEPGLRAFFDYRERGHSADLELLEVVMPGDFATETLPSVER